MDVERDQPHHTTKTAVLLEHLVWTDGYEAPFCTASGGISSSFSHPEGYSQWVVASRLDPGAQLQWDTGHGDEVLHVVGGSLTVDDDRQCGSGGTVIIEANVPARVRADEPTDLVHFGPTSGDAVVGGELGPPAPDGHVVHVVGPQGIAYVDGDTGYHTVFHADSTCPTCRVTFLVTSSDGPRISPSHSHSADEIIHVTKGEIQVGRITVGTGMSIAIPANVRYGFRTRGYEFLNYRENASFYSRHGQPSILETADVTGAIRSAV